MKRIYIVFLFLLIMTTFISCGQKEINNIGPQIAQMRAICELATLESYYHNVAKYKEEDAEGILLWKKDKQFWIEYSGKVKVGIDMSLVDININNDKVTITLPPAKVLSSKVDENTLTENSYIIAKNSGSVGAIDQTKAYKVAQDNMVKSASEDSALLENAQQRVQTLLAKYIKNIGEATGKHYSIEWVYLNADEDIVTENNDNN